MIFALPASPWEFDEPLFYQALHRFDPAAHHPPPPGYPLFIFVGKLFRLLLPSDFSALVTISVIASIAGFVLLALAFRELAGDETAGVTAALLFYWSPSMLIHSTLPLSDPGAVALLAAALYFGATSRPALFASFAALTVGWRPQFAIFVVPMFLVAVVMRRWWRAVAVFTLVCLAWLTPLVLTLGGIRRLIDFEMGQGAYLIAHDAAESRTGWTPVRIAFRFIGRPWGTEIMALAVLARAAIGGLKARRSTWIPLIAGAAVYLAFALWVMDPADGVRYAIPFTLATAFFAGVGATVLARRFAWVIPAAALITFLAYVGPLLWQRRTIPSPPVQAAAYARSAFPNAIALYELPLWPHAQYFLGDHHPHRIDDGLAKFWNRPDVPLFLYTDGAAASDQPGARVFRWSDSDAYTKMTRNHYRVASIIPLPPQRRFRIVRGISATEREQDGREWRWIDSGAELQLPPGPARTLTLRLALPPAAPIESNVIMIAVNGRIAAKAEVKRPDRTEVTVAIPEGAPMIRFDAARTFIPAEVPSVRSGDRRRLAVELVDLWTTFAR
jgi:hypothetical protein